MNGTMGYQSEGEDDYEDFAASKVVAHYGPQSNVVSGGTSSSTGVVAGNVGLSQNTTFVTGGAPPVSTAGQRSGVNICCLLDDGRRCQRTAGNASYSKRVQKTVFYKRLRLEADNNVQHTYICDYHKNVIQNARLRAKKDSDDDLNESDDTPDVDLYQLQVNTLRRYKKHFKIPTRPGLNKAQLAEILTKHFKTIPVNEKEVITYFIYAIKSGRNKLDNRQADAGASNDYMDRY